MPHPSPQPNPRANPNRGRQKADFSAPVRQRYWAICGVLSLWVVLIVGKLFWLQIARHKEFQDKAQKQQQHTFEVAPRRGVLYDRNLRELAMTVLADSIYAVPQEIDDKDKKATVHALAEAVHVSAEDAWTSEDQIAERVNASRGFAWIARRVTPEVAAKVKALNLKGVYPQKEFQRFYPDNEIAAQVLGYVGVDDNGLGGMEQKFDGRLHGAPGRMYATMDERRHVLGSTVKEPEPGENLELTIDENIQFMAERALDAAMERTHAANGTVVIQDVHTGQILALAIRPTFNPNDFRHATPELLRDHAVSDVYEPGSTFKLVTYSAALDQGVTTPDDIIDCQGGAITLAGRVIHDDKSDHYGRIPVHEALEHSSDVAAVKLALKVGPNHFYDYIRAFGFGSRTGLELPGETRGLLNPPRKWGGSSIGSIAIGQEVAVTPLQLVSMVSTLANGGVYLPPHVVMAQSAVKPGETPAAPLAHPFRAGGELPNPLPPGAHRVISTMSAAQMRKMMEGVVLYGTGKAAQLNGYSSGGKTGTAQKIDPATHTYSKTMHVASFAGIAPVNSPVIAVAVVLDNPKGDYYGAATSAPVFAQVAQETLEYLGVPHDVEVRPVHTPAGALTAKDVEPVQEHTGDVNALMAAVNELPSDDPLRQAVNGSQQSAATDVGEVVVAVRPGDRAAAPAKPAAAPAKPAAAPVPVAEVTSVAVGHGAKMVKVPALIGLPVRKVAEQAAVAGLNLQVEGRGLGRSQMPAAGAQVEAGSAVVVKCTR